MFEFTEKMLKDLFYENDTLSLTRVIAFGGFATFVAGSLYLMINNVSWPDYAVFASYTGGIGSALQLGNKFINSKYNSAQGSYEPTNNPIAKVTDTVEKVTEVAKEANNVVTTTVNTIEHVNQVVDTVKDSSEKLKAGINNIGKLVRK